MLERRVFKNVNKVLCNLVFLIFLCVCMWDALKGLGEVQLTDIH